MHQFHPKQWAGFDGSSQYNRCRWAVVIGVCTLLIATTSQATATNFDDQYSNSAVESSVQDSGSTQSILADTSENLEVIDGRGVSGSPLIIPGNKSNALENVAQNEADKNVWVTDETDSNVIVGSTTNEGVINKLLGEASPRLTFQAEAILLWQGNLSNRPLLSDSLTNVPAVNANQLYAPVSVGPRIGLFVHIDNETTIEANYLTVYNFNSETLTAAGSNQYAMDNLAGMTFADVDTVMTSTSGSFKSVEINWRRWNQGTVTWLNGFRWVEWNQTLGITDNYSGSGTGGSDALSVATGNDLYGAQTGLDILLWNAGGRIKFNGIGKAGVYYNYKAYQRTALLGDRVVGDFAAAADQTSFVGEIGVNGSVQITQWLSWRMGYNFFWLSGVAVPASQLSLVNQPAPNDTATINTHGSVLLHGVTTGLEARW